MSAVEPSDDEALAAVLSVPPGHWTYEAVDAPNVELVFTWENDDNFSVKYGSEHIVACCFDDYGSAGMAGVHDALEAFAEALGVPTRIDGERGR